MKLEQQIGERRGLFQTKFLYLQFCVLEKLKGRVEACIILLSFQSMFLPRVVLLLCLFSFPPLLLDTLKVWKVSSQISTQPNES